MSKIVISYRRSDSQAMAGRIADRLIGHFGERSVFMDVEDIPFGIDFRQHIQTVLSQASVMLAIIGPDWLGVGANQSRRIDDEADPIRVEVETALKQKLRLIPVLINNTTMPQASALPTSMRDFAFINAAPVDAGMDFRLHIERLIRTIEAALNAKSDKIASAGRATGTARARATARTMMFAAALLLVLGGGAAWRFGPWNSGPSNSAGAASSAPASMASLLTTATPSGPSAVAVMPPTSANQRQIGSDPSDAADWTEAQGANSFEAYQAYVVHHPQGLHAADARSAAIANAAQVEPPIGALPTGETVLVDDRVCAPTQIKAVTGGDVTKKVSRIRKCVPRDHPF